MIAGRTPGTESPPLLPASGGQVRRVGELEGRGIDKIRLFSRTQIETAVRDAVGREILACLDGIELDPETRDRLRERALARLSGDLTEGPPAASAPRAPESVAPATTSSAAAGPAFDFAGMEKRLVDEIGRLVSQNWKDGLHDATESQRATIGRLEGRIETLMRALEQVEKMMEDMPAPTAGSAAASAAGAPGGGALGGIKDELLEKLFEANLALRELEAEEELRGSNPAAD